MGKLLRQMKSIAGVQGRGKEIPSQEYSGGRRRDSVGEVSGRFYFYSYSTKKRWDTKP